MGRISLDDLDYFGVISEEDKAFSRKVELYAYSLMLGISVATFGYYLLFG